MRPAPAPLAVLAALVLAWAAQAAVQAQQAIAASPAAMAPPVTLAAGSAGSTSLGASATSATTSLATLLATAQQVLAAHAASGSWDARLSLGSATGFGALDSATVRLERGATLEPQVVVTLGSVVQSTGAVVSVSSGGSDLSVTVLGSKVSAGTATLTMTLVLVPAGGSQPVVSYPYTLSLA